MGPLGTDAGTDATVSAAPGRADGRPAGLVTRSLAAVVDVVVVFVTGILLYGGVAAVRFVIAPRRFSWPTLGGLRLGVIAWALLIVYLTGAWAATGRSVGKQMMGLRVERLDGHGLRVGRAFVRAVLYAAFPIGLVWAAFNRRAASLQDVVVRTRVVYDWRPHAPNDARIEGSA